MLQAQEVDLQVLKKTNFLIKPLHKEVSSYFHSLGQATTCMKNLKIWLIYLKLKIWEDENKQSAKEKLEFQFAC